MKKKKICIILLLVIIINLLADSSLANNNYNIALEKGTEILKVKIYDKDAWRTTVSNFTTPSSWFEGEANFTSARSKYVIKGWNRVSWNTYDTFTKIFLPTIFNPEQIIPLLAIMNNLGYNETTLNNNYTTSYKFWLGLRAKWIFTNSDFEEKPVDANDFFLIFENPEDYSKVLNDYNNIAEKLNEDILIKTSGFSFPHLSGYQFLFFLIQSEFAITKPFSKYLTSLVDELGCNNTRAIDNMLKIERIGETNYTIEVSYGSGGTMRSFVVKDINGVIIYQIVRIDSDWILIFYVIIIILSIFLVALCVFLILRRRKIMQMRRK
ncbi:MAG: hypothetical protein ACFFHD_13425 [Promethearchaeota archaeon]